jgi:hypothetical protein
MFCIVFILHCINMQRKFAALLALQMFCMDEQCGLAGSLLLCRCAAYSCCIAELWVCLSFKAKQISCGTKGFGLTVKQC